jgi:hypothetical protein
VKGVIFALAVGGALLCGQRATAAPCSGIDRPIDAARKAQLAIPIATQLKSDHVTVLKYMAVKDWSIVYVETPDSDPPFVFFRGDPSNTRYVTLWSGAATIHEEQDIKRWAMNNAPGIPRPLAACFAWYVTPPHRDQ